MDHWMKRTLIGRGTSSARTPSPAITERHRARVERHNRLEDRESADRTLSRRAELADAIRAVFGWRQTGPLNQAEIREVSVKFHTLPEHLKSAFRAAVVAEMNYRGVTRR